MEKPSQRTLSLYEPVCLLFLNTILIWVTRIHKLSLRVFSLGSHATSRPQGPKTASSEVRRGSQISREDVEMVMGCMGMDYSREGEQIKELMGFDELSTMFEEKEPSLDELKVAFYVFDENCDGFIDSMELQRVLYKMGFREGLALDACEQMIKNYDEDKDGRINFNEFVKLMDNSFC